nr:putative uncharacterized protein FLJ44672 [Pan troglodytes]
MGLIPDNGLSRPSFSLPAASPGPEPPQVSLSRPTCSLPASSPGPALPPGCVSMPDCCLPKTSLDSAPAHLVAALVGPELPQAKLPRPRSGLTVASPGSAPASDGVSRPQMVSGGWAPPRPAWASRRPLQAQVVLKSASPGPASQQVSKLFWLNSCPAPSRLCRPRTSSSQALRAHLLPLGGLYRPSSGCRTASAGPALASQGRLQTQLSPPRWPPGAKSLLASRQPACGPAPPSWWPVDVQLMPLAHCPEA